MPREVGEDGEEKEGKREGRLTAPFTGSACGGIYTPAGRVCAIW